MIMVVEDAVKDEDGSEIQRDILKQQKEDGKAAVVVVVVMMIMMITMMIMTIQDGAVVLVAAAVDGSATLKVIPKQQKEGGEEAEAPGEMTNTKTMTAMNIQVNTKKKTIMTTKAVVDVDGDQAGQADKDLQA